MRKDNKIVEDAKRLGIETDVNKRWETGMDHHKKSESTFAAISAIDYELDNDYFCWKSGGDGDNGEELMYHLDIYYETLDARRKEKKEKK